MNMQFASHRVVWGFPKVGMQSNYPDRDNFRKPWFKRDTPVSFTPIDQSWYNGIISTQIHYNVNTALDLKLDAINSYGGFHSHGGTQQWMVLFRKYAIEKKRMIWGYPNFRKPPYEFNFTITPWWFETPCCTDRWLIDHRFMSRQISTPQFAESVDHGMWLKQCHHPPVIPISIGP